ncbi:MAG: AMP-binding protein [Bacteroides sp.]
MDKLFDRTLGDWLEHWASVTPDKEYIVYADRDLRFTWSRFNRRVDDMAKGLMAIGVERGTHVGLWAANVPDWLTILYACAKVGAVAVTVNTNYKQSELEYLCRHSDMHTLCIVDREKDSDFVDMTYEMLPELKTSERGHLKSKRFPMMKNVVYIGQEKHRGMFNTPELLLLGNNVTDDRLEEAKRLVLAHDVVNMQYTSGTTGFPKGVMLTHHNITNNGYLTGEHMAFTEEDKLCCCVPLFHCFGVVLATMNCLTHGCTQVMVERFDPLVVLASIHKERCTALYGVPTMFIAQLHHPMFDLFDLRSLRTGIMAGALCPVELMRQVQEKMYMRVTSVYGLTEASPGMTATRIDDPFDVRCHTVGRDFAFTEVKVIDPETGEECVDGVQGEMCCRGYNVMKGYYKDEEGTANAIDRNGFLHSGDLGVKDAEGNYRITGRIKDMIIRGGENIYPREIEEFLYHLDGIKDVQVVGLPSPKYGEVVAAFIILKDGASLVESDIRDFCKSKIARYKIPKHVFFVDQFPMTGSGKIQKFKLKEVGLTLCEQQGIEII